MIKITKQEHNTIFYSCDCGANGMCSFKPMDCDAAIVMGIKCPACKDTERMTLLQYSSEEMKEKLIKNLNNVDLSWVPTLNEQL